MHLWTLLLPVVALASPVPDPKCKPSLPLPLRPVHQFPLGTWLENIFVKSNGDLLVTCLLPTASLYQISKPASSSPIVSLVHTFDSVNGLLGIAETAPDVFVVVGVHFSGIAKPVNGTSSAWEVDFSRAGHHGRSDKGNGAATIRLITALKPALFPNGVVALPHTPTTVLVSDSALGLVWRLDTLTGHYTVSLQFPEMAVAPGAPLPIGINGIKIRKDFLYWTNSFQKVIYRIQIGPDGCAASGAKPQTVANLTQSVFVDDFVIGPGDGSTIWAEEDIGNRIFAVGSDGSYQVVEGKFTELTVAGVTAAAFGRGKTDQKTLYAVTSGGLADPVNGTATEGGKVVGIDTTGYNI